MRRMTIAVSDSIDDELAAFARTNRVSKDESIRPAVAMPDLARQQRRKADRWVSSKKTRIGSCRS